MPVTFGDKPCLDPAALARRCREAGLDTGWFGLANSYTCPRGFEPGVAWALLRRDDLKELLRVGQLEHPYEEPRYFKMEFTSTTSAGLTETATIGRLLFVRADCVTPGAEDADSAYLVQAADRRFFLKYAYPLSGRSPGYPIYNFTHPRTGVYLQDSLRTGASANDPRTRWTWEQMVEDLWLFSFPRDGVAGQEEHFPRILGDYPGLPWQPEFDPDNLHFANMTYREALQTALHLIGCELTYDPIADEFDIVLLGAGDGADDALAALAGRRHWDDYTIPGFWAHTPAYIVFLHRRRWYEHGDTSALPIAPLQPVFKYSEDLPQETFPPEDQWSPALAWTRPDVMHGFGANNQPAPLGSGGLSNFLTRDITELTPKVFDRAAVNARKERVVYPFAVTDERLLPGAQISQVRWAETGAGFAPLAGMTTEVRRDGTVDWPKLPDVVLEPPVCRVVRCTGTTADSNGLYPGAIEVWAHYFTPNPPLWSNSLLPSEVRVVKIKSINGHAPKLDRRYLATYQSTTAPVSPALSGVPVWAAQVPHPDFDP